MLKYLLMFLMAIGITSGAYADTDAVLDDDGEIELTDEQIQQEFQKLQDAMVKRGVKFKPITLSDAEIKQMVQNALDNYEKAKTKEQSIENRVNSSVAIASEGIGGMLLAKRPGGKESGRGC